MTVRIILFPASVLVVISLCGVSLAGEWCVAPPPLGNNRNPGTKQEPFANIQKGINAANDGDTVIVAQGTYLANINFNGKNIVLRSTAPTDWNVVKETIIDGNQAGSVVTFSATEDETCVLCGFTVTNGRARDGGGILGGTEDNHTRAAIRNNVITKNVSTGSGADVRGGGGVAYCDGAIENNMISENSASQGGGIYICHGTIRNNIIVGNSASGAVGGMGGCNGIIENNLIVGNTAQLDGGMGWCNGIIRNCTICGNSAVVHGGGIAHLAPTIQNCIIWGNAAGNNPRLHETGSPSYSFIEDWMNGAVDLDGKPRILVGGMSLTVDIGAYEYRFDFAIGRSTDSNLELSWTMRPQMSYMVFSTSDMMIEPWIEETTILGGKTGGPASWIDPAAPSVLKYYKLEIQ